MLVLSISTNIPILAHSTGPNPYKVAIVLSALDLPYTVKLWEFGDAPNGVKGPNFLNINPNGRVPALEDLNTGVVSWESGAIIHYLLRVYDKSNKLGPRGKSPGSDPSEQDHVDFNKWEFFLVSTLGPMLGQLNWYRHYNSVRNEDALSRYEAQAYRTFDVLEGQLGGSGGESVLPGGFGAVDAHFYPWVSQYGYAGLKLDSYPGIQKWLEVIRKVPAVKKAYERVSSGEKV